MRTPYEIPRNRINILFIGFLIFLVAISYRVVSFQVVRSHDLMEQGSAYRFRENVVPAQRGDILDARGRRLATNVPADRVSAINQKIENPREVAQTLAPLIGRSADWIEARLTEPDREWVDLQRRLTPEASQQVEALDIPGIVLSPEPRRIYPMGDFASQVLGFVNYDYIGSYGVEGAYDDVIGGDAGSLIGERDLAGNVIALGPSVWDPAEDGANMVLSLDSAVQWIIEQALEEAIEEQDASGGTIIVQNPQTGEILGMASRSSYDPNLFDQVQDPSVFSNPAISSTYEPGSTFKALIMALGLQAGAVTPNTVHDGGLYKEIPGGHAIYNSSRVDYGPETMIEVLHHSSNVGAMFVAEQMGQDQFYRGLVSLGFGQPTGIDLQGEESGIFPLPGSESWSPANFYTSAFGQGLAVTPLQLINAVSVLANGGDLMKPYVVKEIQDGDEIITTEPEVIQNVLSPEVSRQITEMLADVTDQTYTRFSVPGYRIASKTGTAQVPSETGGYEEDSTIGSIVGYGPAEDPQFTVLVKIDRPEGVWGEVAAGPAFKRVFEELFLLYGIPPSDPAAVSSQPSADEEQP